MVLYSQTSIVFSLEEGPGILFKALAVFALRQINLTKVGCLLGVSCNISRGSYMQVRFLSIPDCTVDLFFLQIESRPLRKQPLRASDDNNGYSKYNYLRP